MTNNIPTPLTTPYKVPFTPDSHIIRKYADSLYDMISDQVYEWAMDLPEISLPIHLEDEELDEAISTITSQLEILVLQSLMGKIGIKN